MMRYDTVIRLVMLQRLALGILICLLSVPMSEAKTITWQSTVNKNLGVLFFYPSNWRLVKRPSTVVFIPKIRRAGRMIRFDAVPITRVFTSSDDHYSAEKRLDPTEIQEVKFLSFPAMMKTFSTVGGHSHSLVETTFEGTYYSLDLTTRGSFAEDDRWLFENMVSSFELLSSTGSVRLPQGTQVIH